MNDGVPQLLVRERQLAKKLSDALGCPCEIPKRFVNGEKKFCMSAPGGSVPGDSMQALADGLNAAARRRIAIVFDASSSGAKGYKIEVNLQTGAELLDQLGEVLDNFTKQNRTGRY